MTDSADDRLSTERAEIAREEMIEAADETRNTWARARAVARLRGERLASTHLLAALAEDGGPAQGLLGAHGVDGTWVRLRSFTAAETSAALELVQGAAERLACSLHARAVGPMHLLAALLRMPETAACAVLRAGGIEVEKLAAAAHGFLSGAARWRSRARSPIAAARAGSSRSARPSAGAGSAAPRREGERDPVRGEPLTTPLPSRSTAIAPAPHPAPARKPAMPPLRTVATSPARRPSHAVPVHAAAPRPAKSTSPKSKPRLGPWLTANARDLRRASAQGLLDPAVARDDVVERLLDVMQKRRASSPCLCGPSGVGKTAVIHALAHKLAAMEEPDVVLLEVPPAAFLGGTGARGSAAERIRQVAEEAKALEARVVFAVGDLAQLVRAIADAGEGADVALREALESRAFAVLGEADPLVWERAVRAVPGLSRCFTPVEVAEPDDAAAEKMLAAVVPRYAQHHGVAVAPEAVEAAVRIARRYLVGRALPDKAVQLLDLAAARARRATRGSAGAAEVAAVAAELVDVPAERLLATDGQRLLALEAELGRRIVGHAEALARVADVLRRNAAGFRGRRPIGSFLLLGPTGVGKTETARAVAECLFPGRENLTRLDMSEYAEPHSIARLIGAPPGYVGFEAGGMLADALRRRPYQVVLLDEFEKAHPDVHRLFLQVLEDGRLTDGRGQVTDFRNSVVILTSNLGSELFVERKAVGFGRAEAAPAAAQVLAAARRALPPELWNRLDETLVFQPLGADEIRRIARLLLEATFAAATAGRAVTLTADDELVEHLVLAGGYDPAMGARPMRRAIQRLVEAPLARALLRADLPRGARLNVGMRDGAVKVAELPPLPAEVACA